MDLLGESSNENCSWGGDYTVDEIARNIEYNQNQLYQAIELVNEYKDIAYQNGESSTPNIGNVIGEVVCKKNTHC